MNPFSISTQLHLQVRSRDKLLFDDTIKALSSYDDKGTFDVLPGHTNFIGLITKKIILYKNDGAKQEIPIDRAVLQIKKDQVKVFLV